MSSKKITDNAHSPGATARSPGATARSPGATARSPGATVRSPARSPGATVRSPARSPGATARSPARSPARSAGATARSPARSRMIILPNIIKVVKHEDGRPCPWPCTILNNVARYYDIAYDTSTFAVSYTPKQKELLPSSIDDGNLNILLKEPKYTVAMAIYYNYLYPLLINETPDVVFETLNWLLAITLNFNNKIVIANEFNERAWDRLIRKHEDYFKARLPKLVGQGAYGCVYSPSMQCADASEEEYCPSCISKLMEKENALDEMKTYTNLQGIDDDQKYIIKNPKLCVPKKVSLLSCKLDISDPMILTYMNGGPDLSKVIPTGFYQNILKHFANIIKGVSILNDAGVYHLDIKPQNILTGINSNGPYRLIDFGQALKPDLSQDNDNSMFTYIYPPRPIDAFLLSERNISKEKIKTYVQNFVSAIVINGNDEDTLTKLLIDASKQPTIYYDTISKIDIYSIGRILKHIMNSTGGNDKLIMDKLLAESNILAPLGIQRDSAKVFYGKYMNAFKHLM